MQLVDRTTRVQTQARRPRTLQSPLKWNGKQSALCRRLVRGYLCIGKGIACGSVGSLSTCMRRPTHLAKSTTTAFSIQRMANMCAITRAKDGHSSRGHRRSNGPPRSVPRFLCGTSRAGAGERVWCTTCLQWMVTALLGILPALVAARLRSRS